MTLSLLSKKFTDKLLAPPFPEVYHKPFMIKKGGIEGKLTGLSLSIGKVKIAAATVSASPRYKTVYLLFAYIYCKHHANHGEAL
jgi:hypothetical protein